MMSSLFRRSPVPGALALVILVLMACGGVEAPMEPEDEPEQPKLPLEAVEGQAIFAIDNKNTLFLFGSENPGTIPHAVKIAGLPLLNRIVGIDVRPSTGELYGIGNDSRVYIIEPVSGVATPVASNRFEPTIARVFDTHFGMAFDPETERIRLISSESQVNWSIDPDDGTAVREGNPRYAAGDRNEGKRLEIATLAYVPLSFLNDSAPLAARPRDAFTAAAHDASDDPLRALVYDAFNGALAESIDPETGEFTSLGPVEGISVSKCAAMTFDPTAALIMVAPVIGLAAPELGPLYALLRMSPTGVVSSTAGLLGNETVPLFIQSMSLAKALSSSESRDRVEAGGIGLSLDPQATTRSALTAGARVAPCRISP